VLSSVWRTLTYHELLHYLQCVSMLSAILPGLTKRRLADRPDDGSGRLGRLVNVIFSVSNQLAVS